MARSILWFRRDLRIADHPALAAAAAAGEVVPLFVVDPLLLGRSGAPRRAFMVDALAGLDDSLGGALVFRHGDPADVVPRVAAEVGADAVYVSRDHAPYGRRRDAAVSERLAADGRRLVGVGSNYVVDPGTVAKADGSPYAVFTPFMRAWKGVVRAEQAETSPGDRPGSALGRTVSADWVGRDRFPSEDPPVRPPESELPDDMPPADPASVRRRWEGFVDRDLDRYDRRRNSPAIDGTSRMSPALRWGLVHPRQLLADLAPDGTGPRAHDRFRSEIVWREFYADVLLRRPDSVTANLQAKMDALPVDTDARARKRFEAWCAGRTGFPIVDAGMRQLHGIGWMHNRVRMIVGSFLVKDLHLPWQWGSKWFMQHLVDGDLASNTHGWQWVAGTGTDAAPFFRVFNPTLQSEKFDPDGDYIRRWVPELAGVEGAAVHDPGMFRPDGYPAPIVDHATERNEALSRYKSIGAATR